VTLGIVIENWSEAETTGLIASLVISAGITFSFQLSNPLDILFGISWERSLKTHKITVIAGLILGCLHGIPQIDTPVELDDQTSSGLAMLITVGTQPLLYILLTGIFYEVFAYLHWVSIAIIGIAAIIHGAIAIPITLAIGIVDRLVCWYLNLHHTNASLVLVSSQVTEISVKKLFDYRHGQYAFLCVRSVGGFEFHPFSISSTSTQENMTFHIKAAGNWTDKLRKIAATGPTNVPVTILGPYGMPSINFYDEHCKVYCLFSAGSGISYNISIANFLLKRSKVDKIYLIWILRDKEFARALTIVDDELKLSKDEPSCLSHRLLSLQIYITGQTEINSPMSPADEAFTKESKETLSYGRPNLDVTFAAAKDEALQRNADPQRPCVGVSACGPPSLLGTVTELCRKWSAAQECDFELHREVFKF
jgi:NADPH oxidase